MRRKTAGHGGERVNVVGADTDPCAKQSKGGVIGPLELIEVEHCGQSIEMTWGFVNPRCVWERVR